ncbi:MAG TPA: kelch repeat-containing protein, partial [Chthonomonadales bacterium]|nr:kelch repeat-containing protein [Chthonomonadales bacterium]
RFVAARTMAAARSFLPTVVLRDGTVLAPGGYRSGHGTIRDCELYDPAAGKWRTTGSMRDNRELHTATLLPDGGVLVTGGFSNDTVLRSAELYNPLKGRFQKVQSMKAARFGHTAALLGAERLIVAGGRTHRDVSLTSTEIYLPERNEWAEGPPLKEDRFRHTATPLADGRILFTGGYSSTQKKTLASAEIYDPRTDRFTLLPTSMSDGRMDHTATLLLNGRVLVVGGWSSQIGATVASADLFDPATGAFTPVEPLPESRHEHTATLLPDGTVLIVGGLHYSPETQRTLNDGYLFVL